MGVDTSFILDIDLSTCSSHSGNLLAKDVVVDKHLCADVVIMKVFKQPDIEKHIVLKGNLEFTKQIWAVTKKKIKSKVKELIFNDEFVDKIRRQLELHEPICQNFDTSIADAAHLWLDLKLPDQFEEVLKQRQEMALNVYALVAYYFHPVYDNQKLTLSHTKIINQFLLQTLDSDGMNEWDSFNIKSGIFKILSQKNLKP
ncbi:hypothetical protein FQA39_LY06057 [Lamprigera yunnana]|nr:hypothetical protein FQA39_LY06057 [Lamprigera yunnana]